MTQPEFTGKGAKSVKRSSTSWINPDDCSEVTSECPSEFWGRSRFGQENSIKLAELLKLSSLSEEEDSSFGGSPKGSPFKETEGDSDLLCFCGSNSFTVSPSKSGKHWECQDCYRSHTKNEWRRLMKLPHITSAEVLPMSTISDLEELYPSDHIAWHAELGYMHHAIVNNVDTYRGRIEVYEFSGNSMEKANGVIQRSWKTNLEGDLLYRYDYNPSHCLTVDEVLRRAEERIGMKNHSLIFNNCEHFATWCKTGESLSSQVSNAVDQAAHVGNTVMWLAGYDKVSQMLESSATSLNHQNKLSSSGKKAVRFNVGAVANSEKDVLAKNLDKYERAHSEGHITSAAYAELRADETAKAITKVAATGLGSLASLALEIDPAIGETLGYVIGQALAPAAGREAARMSRGLSE